MRQRHLAVIDQVHQGSTKGAQTETCVVDSADKVVERLLLGTATQSHQNPDRHIDHPPRRAIGPPVHLSHRFRPSLDIPCLPRADEHWLSSPPAPTRGRLP
jgi:hypothetical protein